MKVFFEKKCCAVLLRCAACLLCWAVAVAPARAQDSLAVWFSKVEEAYYEREFAVCFDYLTKLKAAPTSRKNADSVRASIGYWEGCVYTELGFYPKSESLLRESVRTFEQIKDYRSAATALIDLDYLATRRGGPNVADWPAVTRAAELLETVRDTPLLILCYDNLAYDFFAARDLEKALQYGHKSEALWRGRGCEPMHPNPLDNIGEYYLYLKKYDRAEAYLRECIERCEKYPAKASETAKYESYLNLGKVCALTGRNAEGIRYLREAIAYGQRSGELHVARFASEALVEEAISRKDYRTAIEIQREFTAITDSLRKGELAAQYANNQLIWQINQREKEFQNLQTTLEAEQKFNWISGLLLFCFVLISVAVYALYRQNRQFNVKLREEVARQTDALRRSNEELERFAYIASHDLRTPLRNVISFVGLLERRMRKFAEEAEIMEYLGFIKEYAYRMNTIVSDVLAFSNIGQQQQSEPAKRLELGVVARQVVRSLDEVVRAKNGVVTIAPAMPAAMANPGQIEQLLANLIENGLKYNRSEVPRVEVGFDIHAEEPAFFVRDNGIGIEPQYVQRVFEMFARLHSAAEFTGTGLGLAICKKIVEQNGGRIWLESQAGIGTTLFFTLPLAEASEEETPSQP